MPVLYASAGCASPRSAASLRTKRQTSSGVLPAAVGSSRLHAISTRRHCPSASGVCSSAMACTALPTKQRTHAYTHTHIHRFRGKTGRAREHGQCRVCATASGGARVCRERAHRSPPPRSLTARAICLPTWRSAAFVGASGTFRFITSGVAPTHTTPRPCPTGRLVDAPGPKSGVGRPPSCCGGTPSHEPVPQPLKYPIARRSSASVCSVRDAAP